MSVAQGDRSCQLSQSSSIHDWLDSLSDFQQISARNTRKRKSNNIVQVFAQRESDRPHKRPRYPLSEVHLDNMQNSPSMSRPQSKKHAAPDSPRNPSPTKRITPVSDVTAESAQAERGQDELAENTPRPSRRFFQLEPSRSEADTSEASSTRSQSPVKMSELNGMDGGCRLEALGNVDDVKEGHPLFRIRNLLDRFDDFSAGIGVIPAALKPSLQHDSRVKREFRFSHHFDDTGKRDALGRMPSLEEMLRIRDKTNTCKKLQEHEPGWNCAVHYRVLDMALDTSTHAQQLHVANVTTARVKPDSLLPSWRSGERSRSKLVDFAITLRPSTVTSAACKNLDPLPGAPSRSLNHTCINTILDMPIAISVETKSQDGHGDKARVQLATWVAAHFNRLEKLLENAGRRDVELPVLPLLVAEGAQWTFIPATRNPNGENTLWEWPPSGGTDSILGEYKILGILHLLFEWAQTDYRTWFEANAAPLTPKERQILLKI